MIGAAIFEESLTSDDSHDGGPLVIEMDSSSYYSSPSGCQSETVLLPNKAQAVKDCTCVPGSDYEYVNEGRECVYSSNASVIQVGTCSDGECTEENLTTHEISKNPREQRYNPEDDLCMQLTTKVNQEFFPVSRCQVYCRGWGVRPLNDERLCVLRTKEIRSVFGKKKRVVTKTGVCRLGVCVEANMTPWRHPRGCKDRNVKHGGKILAENCTSFCDNGVREEREEGTICLLEKKSSWIKDVTIKGIRRKGTCIKTPPLDGTLVVWDPNTRCAVYQEQVTLTKFAAPMCSMYCSGRFKPMQDGTPCVLERSFDFWWKSKVKRLGVCRLGRCIEKGPSMPGASSRVPSRLRSPRRPRRNRKAHSGCMLSGGMCELCVRKSNERNFVSAAVRSLPNIFRKMEKHIRDWRVPIRKLCTGAILSRNRRTLITIRPKRSKKKMFFLYIF
uniref:Putative secreted protein n=1 Tax=Ixodes ricinus TaxID=34613 RepID=A0A0K8R4F4_IXORI